MDKVVVTGGAGFIGSHLCEALVVRGHHVVALDSLRTGYARNLSAVADSVELIEADVRDFDAVSRACAGARWVLHQAAMVSVVESLEKPLECHAINGDGTLNVLEAARRAGVERVTFAASAAAYGRSESTPKRETDPVDPVSNYAATKLYGEHLASAYSASLGLPVFALRYFNVFGPRQDPSGMYSGVISKFAERVVGRRDVTVFGDGLQTRDFVNVDDVVQANLRALQAPVSGAGQAINIGTGRSVTLLDLLDALERIVGYSPARTFKEPREGDVRHSRADVSRAAMLLDYAPTVTLEEGLRTLVAAQG